MTFTDGCLAKRIAIAILALGFALAAGCRRDEPDEPRVGTRVAPKTSEDDAAVFQAVLDTELKRRKGTLVFSSTVRPRAVARGDFANCFGHGPVAAEGLPSAFGPPSNAPPQAFGGRPAQAPVWDDLTQAFRARNTKLSALPHFRTERPVVWVSSAELSAVFKQHFWKGFHKHFPGAIGYSSFSFPGYTSDRQLAVVYFDFSAGGRDGHGDYCLVAREGKVWRVLITAGVWRS